MRIPPKESGNFTCPRQPGGLNLSPQSCADLYQRGKTAEKWQTAYLCRGCAIGAGHAGEKVRPISETPTDRCECGNVAHRLIYGRLCVSCYNRMVEALKDRNARGDAPKKLRARRAGDLAWVRIGGVVYVGVAGKVRALSRAPGVLPSKQWSLFDTIWP